MTTSPEVRKELGRAIAFLSSLLLLSVFLASCCSKNPDGSTTCSVTFTGAGGTCSNSSNIGGYIIFANGTSPAPGSDIVIQWSNDSFVTSTNTLGVINNSQGFPVVPFSFSFNFCSPNTTIQLRAFQSTNNSDIWVLGNPVGRDDGTSNGNGSYTGVTGSGRNPITIFLDGTGAQ